MVISGGVILNYLEKKNGDFVYANGSQIFSHVVSWNWIVKEEVIFIWNLIEKLVEGRAG